jgi:hypothetical protein
MTNRSPPQFFALVFALSSPFYLIGDLTKLQVVPGVPLSDFAFVCPVTAAAGLRSESYASNRVAG